MSGRHGRILVAVAVLASGCGVDDLRDLLTPDGGAAPTGPADAGPAAPSAGCNTVPLDGSLVIATRLTRALSFAGGTPLAGTYRLVRTEVPSGALPAGERRTIVIAGSGLQFASGSGAAESRWNATFDTVNVDMTMTRSCGGAGTRQAFKYTASADALLLKNDLDVIYTYQRR